MEEKMSGIELPDNFKTVIMKLHPEIEDMVIVNYDVQKKYNPIDFIPISYFMVNLNVNFKQDSIPKGPKEFYNESFKDLFKMTYGVEMDFISFKVESLIVPPVKTNEDKFFELFKKKVDGKNC